MFEKLPLLLSTSSYAEFSLFRLLIHHISVKHLLQPLNLSDYNIKMYKFIILLSLIIISDLS